MPNARIEAADSAGAEAEISAAWPRLGEITVPTVVMIGRLALKKSWRDELAARIIPGLDSGFSTASRMSRTSKGDPATLDEIAAFVDAVAAR